MLGCGHLREDRQARFMFRFTEPDEASLTHALEGIGAGTRLPDAAAQHFHLGNLGQGSRRGEDLLLALNAAGAGDDDGGEQGINPPA